MADIPKISVVMPVCDGRPFLDTALGSVLDQTYTDFEFIIVDDGSTDGSAEVLRHHASRDDRLRVFQQKNLGATLAQNRGVQEAQGEYIARMDADDVSLPKRFERQVAYLEANPGCSAVGGQALLIDENGEPIRNSTSPPFSDDDGQMEGLLEEHRAIEKALLEGEWPLVHPAVMMRRAVVEGAGGYDERFQANQDHDLFLRLAEHGRLANLPTMVLKYRRHRRQVTAERSGRNFASKYRKTKIRREAHQRRGLPLPEDLRLSALGRLLLRRELSKTPLWSLIQNVWGALRKGESIQTDNSA